MVTNKLTIGILAHVDAGKTTLAEGLLYTTGAIRSQGRVDHKDAFLDMFQIEKERGITIFSKEAVLQLGDYTVTLLDTPGHTDFGSEMERTLQVLDYAILVISGSEGIQGHTMTLWRLLEAYNIPTFIFVNKMDIDGCDRAVLMNQIKERLSGHCVDFASSSRDEDIAVCDEQLFEEYLESGIVDNDNIRAMICNRNLFPCVFGSALKMDGVDTLVDHLIRYTRCKDYGDIFGARVFKISRDKAGVRLAHLKVTGGRMQVRMPLESCGGKIDQIRIYHGDKFTAIDSAEAGTVCAVTGIPKAYAGQCIGSETNEFKPMLDPVLEYELLIPDECNVHELYLNLHQLEEEDPQLNVVWDKENECISVRIMGEIQIQILHDIIADRFGVDVAFGEGRIVYKETIRDSVEGVGHYEPLRHYSEVHLMIEPAEPGSGITIRSDVNNDELAASWQNLIQIHLLERPLRGVLTGAELTDVEITIVSGKAHLKHTEPGDFRQATYRAVRQGLMKAESVLLEPVYEFRIEVPADMVGRTMSDIQKMSGTFEPPHIDADVAILRGNAPIACMSGYYRQLIAYSRGMGSMTCVPAGYMPCHNAEEILDSCTYDPDSDLEYPSGSIFCTHGAGFFVPWDKVEDYMHLPLIKSRNMDEDNVGESIEPVNTRTSSGSNSTSFLSGSGMDDDLKRIFERTYGQGRSAGNNNKKKREAQETDFNNIEIKNYEHMDKYLIVDGYNILFAWEDFAKDDFGIARERLIDMMCNYRGSSDLNLVLVFDGYKVQGNAGTVEERNGIEVVYTKERETADQYIERLVSNIGKDCDVTVATSDYLEQIIIFGSGGRRISAREFRDVVMNEGIRVRETAAKKTGDTRNRVLYQLLKEFI